MASVEDLLEARPIKSNRELLAFDIPSRNVVWKDLIVPVSRRGKVRYLGRDFKHLRLEREIHGGRDGTGGPKVFVCHDFMGNYREDRHYSSSKKFDDYRFYHWSGIDYFCYFSHNYVTIPPAGWINAAHKHGVVMLGTFIVEGGNCNIITEILQSRQLVEQTVDALVRLCDHFCFEGYLLNLECGIHRDGLENLEYFVETLSNRIHTYIPHGTVIWYDSLTSSGALHHQNELNHRNRLFFGLCDGMLINYAWSDQSLQRTADIIKQFYQGQEHKAFVGIDVFGRSQPAKFDTCKLVERILPYGFSVGLFAIGWTLEHLKGKYDIQTMEGDEVLNEVFLNDNDVFWDLLWQYLPTKTYTDVPFYSNFCIGSGIYQFGYGRRQVERFFNLSKQSLQPSVPLYGVCKRHFGEGVNGGSCLSVKKCNENIELFCTDFYVPKSFLFAFASKVLHDEANLECVLQIHVNDSLSDKYQIVCGNQKLPSVVNNQIFLAPVERIHNHHIATYLAQSFSQMKIPFSLANGWRVQYYLAKFNKPVRVTDIGVILKSLQDVEAYLGAIYFHATDIDVDKFAIIIDFGEIRENTV